MRDYQSSSLGLAGSLLIAHPNLLDPNFRRSIVVIAEHDAADGAIGLVINRDTGRRVSDLIDTEEEPGLASLMEVPVFHGGPVASDQLTFASFAWELASQTLICRTHLELDEARRLMGEPGIVVRAFIGYAGWSSGQLEEELEQKAWVVQKADEAVLDPERCKQMWFTIIQEYGPWFRLLATAPDDPSLN